MAGVENSPAQIQDRPGNQEMERSDQTTQQNPPSESLRSKLLAHYNKGMKKPKPSTITSPLTPEVINRVAVPLYLFTVISTLKIGIFDVMPLIYEGNDNVVFLQQFLVGFIFTELMINWFGIRYVDSSYQRYHRLHMDGTSSKTLSNGNILTSQVDSLDSSSATLMPLIIETNETKEILQDTKSEELPSSVNLKSPGEIARDTTSALKKEAELANLEMDKKFQQMSSRSIDDLINSPSQKDKVSSNSSLLLADGNSVTDIKASSDSVFSPMPSTTTNGKTITKVYPYWSWAPCYDCGWTRPPRCHHCPLCRACILKRDHHCFFAGSCVGYRNHRFFCVFLIWAFIGCAYATLHGFPYIGMYLWSDMSYFDVLFPVAIIRFVLGFLPFQAALSVTTLTLLLYFDILTLTFIYAHSHLICWGLTSFEKACLKSSLEIKDMRKLDKKIRAVFGPYWLLCFLLPTHFFFEPEEDPIHWLDIQVFKH